LGDPAAIVKDTITLVDDDGEHAVQLYVR
jgi:hypothetical protein